MFDFKILFAIIFIIISDENLNQVFSQIHVRVAYLFFFVFSSWIINEFFNGIYNILILYKSVLQVKIVHHNCLSQCAAPYVIWNPHEQEVLYSTCMGNFNFWILLPGRERYLGFLLRPCVMNISWLYQTCYNNIVTSVIMPSSLLQVVNNNLEHAVQR